MSMNQYFPEPYECSSGNEMSNWIYHGTIVVTRVARRNIPSLIICAPQLAGDLLLKMLR